MSEYRKFFDPLIKNVEGSSDSSYTDSNGNPTVGQGLNLNDPTVQGLVAMHGYDPEDVKAGNRSIASEDLNSIQNSYLNGREKLVANKIGPDLYNTLAPNEKAAVMSMGYQSLNNLGPALTGHLASGDKPNAIKEMILNTNADNDPGILSRRMQEAQTYSPDPVTFSSAFKIMSLEEKQKLNDIINSAQNENVRQDLQTKYGPYINQEYSKPDFSRLNKLFNLTGSKQDDGQ